MGNVHTLDSLNNGRAQATIINEENVNNGTQLVSVLRLRATVPAGSEVRVAENALERAVEEFRKYTEENGSSSIAESFPDLYPAPDGEEPGSNNISLFELIKKIYNRLINSDIQVNDSNIDSLITLIKKEEESENLSEGVKTVLENITLNLNETLPSVGMRPLGNFGDITLNQLVYNIQNFNFSMVLDNTELLVYPITLLPFSLVLPDYKLVRSYMRHCDNIEDIRSPLGQNERLRMHQLRIRRVSIAAAVGLIIPLSTLMILKFGRLNIFDSFKINLKNDTFIEPSSGKQVPPLTAVGEQMQKSIITLFYLNKYKGPRPFKAVAAPTGKGIRKQAFSKYKYKESKLSCNNNKNKNNNNNKYFYILITIILLIIIISSLFYFNKLTLLFNAQATILNIILGIWYLLFVFNFIYNLIGYFILKIKGKIDIDLSFIKIKCIISLIESFIIIKNSNDNLAIDILQKNINRQLIIYIIVLTLAFILFVLL